jgi:hypothetical protein
MSDDEEGDASYAMLVTGCSPPELALRAWCEVPLWLRARALIDEHARLKRIHQLALLEERAPSRRIVSIRLCNCSISSLGLIPFIRAPHRFFSASRRFNRLLSAFVPPRRADRDGVHFAA